MLHLRHGLIYTIEFWSLISTDAHLSKLYTASCMLLFSMDAIEQIEKHEIQPFKVLYWPIPALPGEDRILEKPPVAESQNLC